MTFTFDELKLARERGYSDDEIWNTLSSEDKEIGLAKERGYSLEEVASITSGQPVPEGFAARPVEPEPERRAGGGVAGGAADIGVSFMKGLGTGTRMISDVFGANNPVSKAIAGYEDYMDSLLSAESKQDSQEISHILKDAEGKGILPQIMAGLEAFTVAPAEMTATTMGMMLPNLAGGVYAKAAQLTKAGALGLQMGIGAAQGIGSVKGQIYTAVQEELRQKGLPEDQIEPIATKAQAYNGKNLDQLLIAGGLGAIAASTGAEKIMTRLITGAGKEATEDIIKATIKGGLSEAPIEALQGGQEKLAENIALQRIGVDVPTMQGVIPAATMEATAGLLIGGGFGAVESVVSPEKRETDDIETKSEQTSRELTAENTPMAQAMVQELARRENAVKNLQDAYDALEPTSQEAQRLKLELGDAQRKLGAFKETAANAGLSVTITPVEQRQIELAKQIAAPVEPAPTTPAPLPEAAPAPITPAEEAKPKAPPKYSPEGLAALTDAELASEEQSLALSVNREAVTDPQSELASLYQGALDLVRAEKSRREAATVTETPAVTPAPVSETITPAVEAAPVTPAPAEVPAITPAPVAETPAEAPAPEVVPTIEEQVIAIVPPETLAEIDKKFPNLSKFVRKNTPLFNLKASYLSERKKTTKITNAEIKAVMDNAEIQTPLQIENALSSLLEETKETTKRKELSQSEKNAIIEIIGKYTYSSISEDKLRQELSKMRKERANLNKMFESAKKKGNTATASEAMRKMRQLDDSIKRFNDARKEIDAIYATPAVSETITPAAPAPVGIAVGNRIKLGKSPQTYTIEEVLPQSEAERGLGEQFYSVKNERTGEVQTVESKDLKPVLARVRRGEKGGVLFLTREDFIQAGQNIYEAGMEFATWARQMVQRFGDAVRQFLGDIWQAVSGIPAKVNELAGFLPGKGEAGAVAFGRGEEPPKPPKKPAEPAAAPEKPAPERKQVAGLKFGAPKTTPIGINKKTEEIVQKQIFNGSITPSPENTAQAYELIERLLDPRDGGKFADEINETTRSQMEEGEKRKVDETIGAVKLGNELFKYAVNLAAKGDLRMLQLLFERANDFATSGTATISTDARNLQARANLASWVRRAAEAQKKGVVNSVAIQIFGPSVTKEQMDSIIAALNAVNKTKTAEAEQIYDDLETTGEKAGVDIRSAVERAIQKADPTTRDPWVMALEILKAIEGFRAFTYQKVKGATNKTIQGLVSKIPFSKNLANYQKKMIDTGAGGLNTLFWKTMSDKENKLGPLGEVDMAINRNLAGIVKDALVKLGLKGEPKNTKMTLIEQVANILSNNELSKAKMLEADRIVREEIDRKEAKEIEDAGDNAELVEIAEAKANGLRQAWDEAMSRQLDIPISDSTLRRLIFSKLKDDKSSIRELADAIVNDKTIGGARKERLLTSIIQQLDGLTKEGDTKRDYTKLREALSAQLDNMVEQSTLKRRANSALRKVAKEANPDGQAERQIERLAEIQSDVQSWPKAREDKVRDIVREDLKQKLDLGLKVREKIKAAWKGVLRQKLIDAGVKPDTAERLTDIVWRQHEINYLNRKMKDVEMAVTRGSIAPIVNAIKNTPLSQQQDPKWKRNVAFDFLKNAGLDDQTAGRIADLMDLTLQKVFVRAQEKAFNDIVSKQLKTEGSRRQLQRFLQAIRAGALDPTKNLTSEIAAQNGWTGFTSEQVARLNELDTIINDPDALDLQRSKAYKEINDIIKTSKLDPNVKDVLSAYYTAQALSGIPTTTVNIFSAVGFSMRNAMTDTMRLAATNPSALPAVFDTFVSSWKTYASEVLFSFKNNIQRRGTVEYLSNDDALLRLYNKGKRQWNEGKRAEGFKNMMFGMMEYVGRWLKALDEGAVSVLEQQGLTRYAMMAMKQAGISSKDATAAANYVQSQKEQFIINAIAKGMSKTEAKALSDDVFRGAWIEALSKLKIDSQEVLDASLNDALSSIGRINNTFDQLRQEERNVRDAGFVSSLPIGLLERLGEAMNSPNATEGQRIFYRMAYGFAIVPARVMREAAWFSPYGFVRFGLDAFAKARGKTSPYAQSLGTDLQYRQRLTEAIAGSIVLGALFALSKSSVDDPEDESLFKIVVTGNGPERRLDPQFYDAYFKKYSRNALHVFIGKTKFKVNIERGFEAFAIPFMLAGAIDDWKIRKRFEESKKTPSDLSDASILLGSAFLSFSRRGPFAAYMDGIVSSRNSDDALSSLGSFLTFTLKTFVPVAGTSLARNVSDFVSDPVERRSMEGALWANTPVIGPMMGTKSMNAIGETTGAGELSDRIYKLGMPIVFNIPNTPEQTKLRDLIIEKGQGPDIPTRYDARRTLGFELTDKQFEKYVTTYGQYMKKRMLESYPSLKSKSPVKYVETLQKYQETARTKAKTAVSQMQP